jgi:hypothetical protein
MAFDFEKAEREASAVVKPNIAAIVLGQSSAGKSFFTGTLPGKTLFLYTQGEEHGRDSALLGAENGGKVVPIALDLVDGKVIGADAAYKRLLSMLDTESIKKAGFTSIVIDGLTELEQLVRATSEWATLCRTSKGEHNGFAEPTATIKMIRPVLDALRGLQRELGTNYVVTCLLMVKGVADDGEITSSEPKLVGYEVAALLIPQFPDQIMIGRMTNEAGVTKPRLQFNAIASKAVKEKSGEIKKLIGFTPRLRGVSELPANMAADFKAVLKLKGAK